MTYELIVLPVDRALTADEAETEVRRLRRSRGLGFGLGHDRRLDPFIEAMGRRYWQLRARTPIPAPFAFDVTRSCVVVGIPWHRVDEVVTAVGEAAFGTGVAVWDPQRGVVGLPSGLAEAPLGAEGTAPYVARGTAVLAPADRVAMARPIDGRDPDDSDGPAGGGAGGAGEALRGVGVGQLSPLGFEVTAELADEVAADPGRMPGRLQTPQRRDELLAALLDPAAPARHLAIAQLAGWDPDPAVAGALRPLLASEDVYEASQAAAGLARQRDVTDLPAVLGVLRRLSPADGAPRGAMLVPLRAALALAALAGPEIVEGVRVRAREWRAAGPSRRPAWGRELDEELDALLDG